MKRLLIIAVCSSISFVALAQSGSGYLKSSPTSKLIADTVVNTATVTQTIAISGYNDAVTLQPVITKVTGTAAGVVRLYGSLDGINFSRINPTDSLVVTNVTTSSKVFAIANPSSYTYYRVGYTGTGTMKCAIKTLAVWRRR